MSTGTDAQTARLEVLATGPQSLIQDLGRPGKFALGVGVSGAADPAALRLANRLLANPESAAAIECLIGGLAVRFDRAVLICVTGAAAQLTVDHVPHGRAAVVAVQPGQCVRLAPAERGVRAYLAVRGGIDVPAVLGSRSYDTLAQLGPPPLVAGDVLPIGAPPSAYPVVDFAPVPEPALDPPPIRVDFGPRADWFADPAVLVRGSWIVSPDSDRIGVRLDRADGPPLSRAHDGELATEGAPLGAIQVPPSGQPVVFLADHPITGGYPVIGVVRAADLGHIAQARPGARLRLYGR